MYSRKMNTVILSKIYAAPPICEREILRYAGCKGDAGEIQALLKNCINEVSKKLTYKVCYGEFQIKTVDNTCDFGVMSFESENLKKNLDECSKAVIFAATVGVELDRLIAKYGRISPSKAFMLQALGAERIESLCDVFCEDIKKEYNTKIKPRFSAGYGDLPLECQRQIFAVLNCEKRIGLTLNDRLIMSPSKSVTAIVGLCDK